jgi:hypothetical protein
VSKKIFYSFCCLVFLGTCISPSFSFATTVTLLVEPSTGSPYVFSVNGSSTFTDLTCLNDQRKINTGESWVATAENLESMITNPTLYPTDGTMTLTELKEDAYLDSLYGSNTTVNQEIQDAIWTILDRATGKIGSTSYDYTSLPGSGSTLTAEETAVKNDLTAAISSLTTETSSFYSEFTFYIPTVYGQSYQDDKSGTIPQEFLGRTVVTPEPSSLIFLGTGMAALAGLMRRRIKPSVNS